MTTAVLGDPVGGMASPKSRNFFLQADIAEGTDMMRHTVCVCVYI